MPLQVHTCPPRYSSTPWHARQSCACVSIAYLSLLYDALSHTRRTRLVPTAFAVLLRLFRPLRSLRCLAPRSLTRSLTRSAPLCFDPCSPPTALPLPPLPSLTAPRRSARSSRIALLLTRSARTGQLRRIAAEYEKAGAAEEVPLELRAQALKMCEDEYGLDDPRSRELELAMAGDYMRVGHVARAMALKKHVQHVEGDPARDANVEGRVRRRR